MGIANCISNANRCSVPFLVSDAVLVFTAVRGASVWGRLVAEEHLQLSE